jgi:type IV pilus assembly protein PilX
MRPINVRPPARGVALVVALLFLLVVTIISVVAAGNSSIGLKMSANLQDSYSSFQSAEAGVIAVLSLAGDAANDPFDGNDSLDPFAGVTPDPLGKLNDGPSSVDVDVYLTTAATTCPRQALGYSIDLLACDYYRIESEHEVEKQARTKVNLGVVKTIIGDAGP